MNRESLPLLPEHRREAGALLIVAVALVTANLRMSITAVGPLIDEIGRSEQISAGMLGLLGALPLIFWGLVSPVSYWLSSKIGMTNAVSCSLVALALGTVWRSLPGMHANLWLGTALIGSGLAVANVLLPAIIKRDFASRVPMMMGLYSALLGGMGAVGAGIAVPISEFAPFGGVALGWRVTLAAMGALVPVALIVWVVAFRRRTRPEVTAGEAVSAGEAASAAQLGSAGARVWRDSLAWQVSLYMGAQSAIFYTMSSWFTSFEISNGTPAALGGAEMMAFQVIGIGGSLIVPALARNLRVRRWLPALLPLVGLVAWVGMPLAPGAMPLWLVLGGLVGGGSLTMALTLMAMRARTADHSSALSGMAQAVGYSVAALGPLTFGLLLDVTGSWVVPFALIWVAALAQLAIGISVGRPRFILDRH